MVAWSDDVKLPDRGVPSAKSQPWPDTADTSAQGSGPRSGSSMVRRAAPDPHGLGPVWRRRHDDRDPLDDLLRDLKQMEDWMRCEPSSGTGESYW